MLVLLYHKLKKQENIKIKLRPDVVSGRSFWVIQFMLLFLRFLLLLFLQF